MSRTPSVTKPFPATIIVENCGAGEPTGWTVENVSSNFLCMQKTGRFSGEVEPFFFLEIMGGGGRGGIS